LAVKKHKTLTGQPLNGYGSIIRQIPSQRMRGGQHQMKVIGIDKLLMKFFAPLGGQRPGKADVELAFVKRLEHLLRSQFAQS
jgi:hypothetical protein